MTSWLLRLLYFAFLPVIVVAASVVGYYSYVSAAQFERIEEQSLGQSLFVLARDRVDEVERRIIAWDNAAFNAININALDTLQEQWPPVAPTISPSVRALVVLDDQNKVGAFVARATQSEQRAFLRLVLDRVVPDLQTQELPLGQLRHLHRAYGGASYLFSYKKTRADDDREYLLVAHHDAGYVLREVIAAVFASDTDHLYNVVEDETGHVYGLNLTKAGDYIVGRRFPTTLYGWRLQVAPREAHLLKERNASRRLNERLLLALAGVVLILGFIFLLYGAAKERRLNEIKTEFVANVSHELKTPLSVIRMFSEMLLTGRVASEAKREEYLATIVRESERLTALIENVLDFSALERGKQTYAMEDNNLVEIVQDAVEAFRHRAEKEGVEIHIETIGTVPTMNIDAQAIALAVYNLLDNAAKYGGGTPIDVHVERTGREVITRVRDRGPGIPRSEMRRVFERFYRVRSDSGIRGSGIGLSLVKHIAEAHGGRAWIDSALGGGTVACIALPTEFTPSGETAIDIGETGRNVGLRP